MHDGPESALLAQARESARQAGALLSKHGLTLATVESATGGLLALLLTDLPGSSGYFAGGLVPYSYEAHETLLRIERRLLEEHGAVSEEVAQAMARSAREVMSSDYALAVTGIMGPSGGTPSKPVGLTYVALAMKDAILCERHVWSSERMGNKLRSALAALTLLVRTLESGNQAGA